MEAMASFDQDIWEQRVRRDIKCSEKLQLALKAISGIHVVVEWCKARSLAVEFKSNGIGEYVPPRLITANYRVKPETQLYTLLHEIGHYQIAMCGSDRFKSESQTGTASAKIDVLSEEYEAWDRGWKLGQYLELELDSKSFNTYRVKCLRSYVKWASDSKDYEL